MERSRSFCILSVSSAARIWRKRRNTGQLPKKKGNMTLKRPSISLKKLQFGEGIFERKNKLFNNNVQGVVHK
jgi:hypothetical protein